MNKLLPVAPLLVAYLISPVASAVAQQPNGGRLDHVIEIPSTLTNASELELVDIEDLNGDGVPELLLSRYEAMAGGVDEAGVVELLDGASQVVLHRWEGSQEEQGLGVALEVVPDQNGDGLQDLLIGSNGWDSYRGRVDLFASAAPYSLISTWTGTQAGEEFGLEVKLIGDLNGDLSPEVAIGAPIWFSAAFGFATGKVYLYELNATQATGLVSTLDGDVYNSGFRYGGEFGTVIEAASDLDSDGVADLYVSAPGDDSGFTSGDVYAISGASGAWLWDDGGDLGDLFGFSLQEVDDLTGDGIPEVLIGAPFARFVEEPSGMVFLYDGRNGEDLFEFAPEFDHGHFGDSIGAADFDLDGVRDFVIGAPVMQRGAVPRVGCVMVYSGADFSLLYQKWGTGSNSAYGIGAKDGVDRDGDGFPEILSWSAELTGSVWDPVAWVLSGRLVPQINATGNSISVSAGGVIDFNLDFPDDAAFYWYQILYSANGRGPIEIGDVSVPLGYDLNLVNAYLQNYSPFLQNPSGLLNPNGNARVTLDLPAGAGSSLLGATVRFAAIARVVWGDWSYASVSVPVTFTP